MTGEAVRPCRGTVAQSDLWLSDPVEHDWRFLDRLAGRLEYGMFYCTRCRAILVEELRYLDPDGVGGEETP